MINERNLQQERDEGIKESKEEKGHGMRDQEDEDDWETIEETEEERKKRKWEEDKQLKKHIRNRGRRAIQNLKKTESRELEDPPRS